MTKSDMLVVSLDRLIGRLDAQARDDGHRPAPWDIREDDGDLVAATRCELCGSDAAARVGDAENGVASRSWAAGKMRLGPCSTPGENQ